MAKDQIIVQLNPDVPPSGCDLAVVNAARRSFGKRSSLNPDGSLKQEDKRLIEFLARGLTAKDFDEIKDSIEYYSHSEDFDEGMYHAEKMFQDLLWKWRNTPTHDTPFNHCHISFEVKAPIFVARQIVKTEYAPFSEFSRRYITDDVEFYIHDYREASKDKKQGSGGLHKDSEYFKRIIDLKNKETLETYNTMIQSGIAPEQARGHLPQDLMTAWTWSATLGAFAKMCRERLGSDAQMETRYVAEQVYGYLKEYFPVSAKALVEGC